MNYVNLAAAIATLSHAEREQTNSYTEWMNQYHQSPKSPPGGFVDLARDIYLRDSAFAAGVSFAIGMMLDADTAAIIEAAAKERAQEQQS